MNTYLIEHKIKTISELWDFTDNQQPFNFRGFEFRQWDFNISDGAIGDAWIAKREVEAKNAESAIQFFRKELIDIVRRVAFVSQCFASADLEPYFILRLNDNPEQVLFLSYSEESEHVSLHFGEEEKESLEKLEKFPNPVVLEYIAQSGRAATYTTRLAMLIIALESIAGEINPGKTNMQYIKDEILKNYDLHDEIFKFGTGIRNKIFHGKEIVGGKDYAQIIYDRIIDFFNVKYGTKINTAVSQPQRHLFGNYYGYKGWLQPRINISDWELKYVLANHDNGNSVHEGGRKEVIFDIVARPDQY